MEETTVNVSETEIAEKVITEECETVSAENAVAAEEENGSDAEVTEAAAEATTDSYAGDDETAENTTAEEATEADYGVLMNEDYREICAAHPEAMAFGSLKEMPNLHRYGELRELGLTPSEAYLAAVFPLSSATLSPDSAERQKAQPILLRRAACGTAGMSYGEMAEAKALFADLSPRELLSLYRRVKQ